ncbi:MAG: hypothetical protein QOI94_2581 [Acidobacteriaceae bacterium]|nr:hypothetical protein [Acidobacteriaceae bacterium]
MAVVIICMFRQYTCPILDSRSSDLITAKWDGEGTASHPKDISKKRHQHRDLSATLRFGRDDKGEACALTESGCSPWVWPPLPKEPQPFPLSSRVIIGLRPT